MDTQYTLEIGERYDFTIDMSTLWPCDTISAVEWTVPSGIITKSDESHTPTTATVWLERIAGGTVEVKATITSSSIPERIEILTFRMLE